MAFLYHIREDGSQIRRWELNAEPLVVGRGDIADACVEDDALSWSHFLITREGASFCLIDLKSSNGTWVNGERVSASKLHPHDTVRAGSSLFYFCDVAVDASAITGRLSALRPAGLETNGALPAGLPPRS
jgi:pSer/pThr/pTyr-binding forkhead associated (FHA) protein